MKKLGLIINPIAGMGGSVGLKGTDNVLCEAIKLGATSKSHEKTYIALEQLTDLKDNMVIYTCSNEMGENIAKILDFKTKIIHSNNFEHTSSDDTIAAARKMLENNVDIIVFSGGDGTAIDIYKGVGEDATVIGIPAGVKIQSSVFAKTPTKAGELAKLFIQEKISLTKEAEVLDIDEGEYRKGNITTKLYGYLKVPFDKRFLQNRKAPSLLSEKAQQYAIANEVIKGMLDDTYYIIGPGSTTRAIMKILDLDYTLIGVDIILNKKLVAIDVTEKKLLNLIGVKECKMIVTPTGGQGYIFGRGNQQLSPEVIKKIGKKNIIIISTKDKIANLKGEPLIVDTGNKEADDIIRGYARIITGSMEEVVYKIQ